MVGKVNLKNPTKMRKSVYGRKNKSKTSNQNEKEIHMNHMDELDEIIKKAEHDISNAPEGKLRIASRKKLRNIIGRKRKVIREGATLGKMKEKSQRN